jgi:ketosteroid isomerase-like protein
LRENKSMNVRRIFILAVSLGMAATAAHAADKYERTLDGKTLVWHSAAQGRVQATWSGDRDDNGYATGRGTLSWYKARRSWLTGSLLPGTKYIQVSQYTGKMVEGKFEGSVVAVDRKGQTRHATFADGRKTSDWVAGPPPSSTKRSEKAVEPLKVAETSTEVPPAPPKSEERLPQTPAATPVPAIQAQPSTPEATASPSDSVQSLAMPPSSLRVGLNHRSSQATPSPENEVKSDAIDKAGEPPSTSPATSGAPAGNDDDARTVAALDSEFHSAVKTNDAAAIDRILSDDFVLVRGSARSLNKMDLLKQLREKQLKYERHDVQEGTQQVRVWHDSAVVTETVWVKGAENGKPVDEKLAVTAMYGRTPNGWRYVAGQAAVPPK